MDNQFNTNLDSDQWIKLNETIALASGCDHKAGCEITEAIGNHDNATWALIEFMDNVTIGQNPTLIQIKTNQTAINNLFKHIADYVVREI